MEIKEFIEKEKKIHIIKKMLSYLNIMIADDKLPFNIAIFHHKNHPDYEALKIVMKDKSVPSYEDLLDNEWNKSE